MFLRGVCGNLELKNRNFWPISLIWTEEIAWKCFKIPLQKIDFLEFFTFLPYFPPRFTLEIGYFEQNRENSHFGVYGALGSWECIIKHILAHFEFCCHLWGCCGVPRRVVVPQKCQQNVKSAKISLIMHSQPATALIKSKVWNLAILLKIANF